MAGRVVLAPVAAALLLIPACTREVTGQGAAAPAGGLPTVLATEPSDTGTDPTGAEPTDTGLPPPESPSPTATPSARPSSSGAPGRPCPAEGSGGVPGGTAATSVVGYQTPTFRIYLCRGTDHRLYYRGVSKANPASAVTLPAGAVPGGYEASTRGDDGHTYLYRVADGRLIIARDGMVLRDEPVTPL